MKTIPKLNALAINITLTEWRCATVCIVGIVVLGGGGIYLCSKLIKNGYQLKNTKGLSITKSAGGEPQKQENPEICWINQKVASGKSRSGSDPTSTMDTSASIFLCELTLRRENYNHSRRTPTSIDLPVFNYRKGETS